MGRGDPGEKPRSTISAIYYVFHYVVVMDTVLYGIIVPLIGTYLAGCMARFSELSPTSELILTVIFTFLLMYAALSLFGEVSYWRELFAFNFFHWTLLQIRDAVNGAMFIFCLFTLASTVESMVNEDKSIKSSYVSEGAGYVFLKTFLEFSRQDTEPTLNNLGLNLPHKGTITDPSFGENERFEHGAAYMLMWAMMTACVSKMSYYNTLFTYLRSMQIFMSMNPIFDDDSVDVSRSSFASRTEYNPSRIENDFVYSLRRTNI